MFKFLHTRRVGEPVLLAIGLLLLGYGAGHEIVYTLLGLTGDAAAREVHGYLPSFGIAAAVLSVVDAFTGDIGDLGIGDAGSWLPADDPHRRA